MEKVQWRAMVRHTTGRTTTVTGMSDRVGRPTGRENKLVSEHGTRTVASRTRNGLQYGTTTHKLTHSGDQHAPPLCTDGQSDN